MTNLSKRKYSFSNQENPFLSPRAAIHRIASTACVNGVNLLRKRITKGIPSTGQRIPSNENHLIQILFNPIEQT